MESEWNQTNIFWGGIGIGIELNIIGPESELNRNRLLPELHIIGSCLWFFLYKFASLLAHPEITLAAKIVTQFEFWPLMLVFVNGTFSSD